MSGGEVVEVVAEGEVDGVSFVWDVDVALGVEELVLEVGSVLLQGVDLVLCVLELFE